MFGRKAHNKFSKYIPVDQREEFKENGKKFGGIIKKKLQNYKERNSDENREKRIKSHKLELQEEQYKTKIHKVKRQRGGIIDKLSQNAGAYPPQSYGLGDPRKGAGSNAMGLGAGEYDGLGKIDGKGEFRGMNSLFGYGEERKQKRTRKKSVKERRPYSGMDDLF